MALHDQKHRIVLSVILLAVLANPVAARTCVDYGAGMVWMAGIPSGSPSDGDIAVVGDVGYLTTNIFNVVDLVSPEQPQVIHEYWLRADGRVDADGSIVVVSDWDYIEVFTIADPRNPVFTSSLPVGERVFDVCVVGNYAYVSCEDSGIVVVDVADPAVPVILGSVGGAGGYRGTHQNGYLYTLIGDSAEDQDLVIFDLATPVTPVEVYRRSAPGARDVVPNGSQLCLSMGSNGFEVADIGDANAASPAWAGVFSDDSVYTSVGIGDYVFTSYMACVDVSGPTPWPTVGSLQPPFSVDSMVPYGDYLLVVGADGLDVYHVAQPEDFEKDPLGTYPSGRYHSYVDVVASGDFAFVTEGYVIDVVDVSDPMSPGLVDFISPGSYVNGRLVIRDEYLYVMADSLEVYDISDPALPELVGTLFAPYATDMILHEGHLYLDSGSHGVQVVSLLVDPETPVKVGQFDVTADRIWPAGEHVHIRDNFGDVHVLDVSDPSRPTSLGSFDESWSVVEVTGTVAYVGGDPLEVYDLTDPVNPVLTKSIPMETSNIQDLEVGSNTLYASTITGGAWAFDLSDRLQPVPLGSIEFPGYHYGLALGDGVLLMASDDVLAVLPIHCGQLASTGQNETPIPTVLELSAWPNPFNPQTTISFDYPVPGEVRLEVFDLAGRMVRTLFLGEAVGRQTVTWDGRDSEMRAVPSGIYLVRLRSDYQTAATKVTLVR